MSAHTAGTAGRGYRADPAAHAWDPDQVEWGQRPVCRHCGGEKREHAPVGRAA